jgi:hypothetical protein
MLIMPPKSGESIDMDLQLPAYPQFCNRKENKLKVSNGEIGAQLHYTWLI